MIQSLSRSIALLLALASLASISSAQCVRPDRLDGGLCCTPAQPFFPTPPGFTQDCLELCWRDCDLEAQVNLKAIWGASSYSTLGPCRRIRQSLALEDLAGNLAWKGRFSFQYSRTWLETDPAGNSMQVWRYLLNGDLKPAPAAGPIPCPVPACAPATNNRVRFTGYMDLARECGTNIQRNAWMLTHACDAVDHNPNFPRGGVFHPERSFTFVGPSAGFAPSPLVPIEAGGSASEAVRRLGVNALGGATCEYEEQADFSIDPFQQLCPCGSPNGLPQWSIAALQLGGVCGTTANTSAANPYLPGFISMGIGRWTDPNIFPGTESLRYNAGGYEYLDPCQGIVRQEVFFGVTTAEGFLAREIRVSGVGAPLLPTFIDQGNSQRLGNARMNVRYRSNHILNLNL